MDSAIRGSSCRRLAAGIILVIAGSGCASLPPERAAPTFLEPAAPVASHQVMPPEECTTTRFDSNDVLKTCRIGGGDWRIVNGTALGTQVGDKYAYLTLPTYFGSIASVTVRGGILSPDNRNFRVAIGHVSAIFNWECDDVDRFTDGWGDAMSVGPRALTAGSTHEIRCTQDGEEIRICVDGREKWRTRGHLRGTVTVYPAVGSTISVTEVEVRGTPVPWIAVDGPSQRAP